eukprot:scaffold83290_cov19-Tisochrysis_lutea.AAC.4
MTTATATPQGCQPGFNTQSEHHVCSVTTFEEGGDQFQQQVRPCHGHTSQDSITPEVLYMQRPLSQRGEVATFVKTGMATPEAHKPAFEAHNPAFDAHLRYHARSSRKVW